MQLHYYRDKRGNFGDDLNAWLWERLLPGVWEPDGTVFCGVGTIFDNLIPPAPRTIVFGSGAGYSPPPDMSHGEWDILCVRGPISVAALGLPADKAVTDGALLLAALPEFAPLPERERHGTIFIPHHEALTVGAWPDVCVRAGIEFVSPCWDSHQVIERIRSAKLVIADAMHAAIVADTMRVPWIAARTSSEISTFKWLDWTMSMSLPYEPVTLPASTTLEEIRDFLLPFYGKRYAFDDFRLEAALAHYKSLMKFRASRTAPLMRDLVYGLLFKRMVHTVRTLPGLRTSLDRADRKRIDRAAQAISLAAGKAGFLSDEAIYRARLGELRHRLSLVANFGDRPGFSGPRAVPAGG